jgi:hypothetical protein
VTASLIICGIFAGGFICGHEFRAWRERIAETFDDRNEMRR